MQIFKKMINLDRNSFHTKLPPISECHTIPYEYVNIDQVDENIVFRFYSKEKECIHQLVYPLDSSVGQSFKDMFYYQKPYPILDYFYVPATFRLILKSFEESTYRRIPYKTWRDLTHNLSKCSQIVIGHRDTVCDIYYYDCASNTAILHEVFEYNDGAFGSFLRDKYSGLFVIEPISPEDLSVEPISTDSLYITHDSRKITINSSGITTFTNDINFTKDTIPTNDLKENNTMNFFNFDFGEVSSNDFAASPYGIAAHNHDNDTWVAYNADTNEVIDVQIFHINMKGLLYKIPTPIINITPGDIVIHQEKPMFVQKVNSDNTITALNYLDASIVTILPLKSPFGFNFITKVVSLMKFNGADTENPFGNMLPFMLMQDDNIDPMMFLFMNQSNENMNPLLMYMMMKNRDSNDMLPMMLMMNGGVFNF